MSIYRKVVFCARWDPKISQTLFINLGRGQEIIDYWGGYWLLGGILILGGDSDTWGQGVWVNPWWGGQGEFGGDNPGGGDRGSLGETNPGDQVQGACPNSPAPAHQGLPQTSPIVTLGKSQVVPLTRLQGSLVTSHIWLQASTISPFPYISIP